ncbi:hypothetical protein [Winogradskyella arenosi]|uniref:Uncharacterized protein n=1 Tax=Winogradskyella arenosi TaxID=533325 RepID=A0A368ZB18_9FLAO|nr:hypothetical protein [Winogradskyella arenosi]RCW90027.1 hypothetical protein DFQ08_106134 [Winogradskyella arenosi]
MNKPFLAALAASLIITSCTTDNSNPFLIKKDHIGLLNDSTKVKDLETIFSKDSVVNVNNRNQIYGGGNTIEVFEKGGKKLLDLSPKTPLDSMSVISTVRIIDERYKTDKDISTISTFKALRDNYKISKIDNLINVIVVSVNEINASFTIDKNELPASMRFDRDLVIDPLQIPEKAKIKFFMLHW